MRMQGFDYTFDPVACESCLGRCCTGESGGIFASMAEFKAIAGFLNLSMDAFIAGYLVKMDRRFSIKEISQGDSHDCIFFDRSRNGCSIYEVRPAQCRTFPFWDYFKSFPHALAQECPGVVFDA